MKQRGTIRLQYVLGDDLISDFIEWHGRQYRHVDSVLPEGFCHPAGSLIGARSCWISPVGSHEQCVIRPGVRVRPAGYEIWRRRTVYELNVSKQLQRAYYWALIEQLGKPHESISIWTRLFPPMQLRNWRARNAWAADELVLAMLEETKIIPRIDLSVNEFKPGDSIAIITAIGAVMVEDVST